MRLVYTILLLVTSYLNAQTENFSVENDFLTWKFIYNEDLDIDQMKSNPRFSFMNDSTGIINKGSVNNKNIKHEYTANFKVESKANKYRVTINNIRFYNETQINFGMFESNVTDYPIETPALNKKGEIKAPKRGPSLTEIMNNHFMELFKMKHKTKDDW